MIKFFDAAKITSIAHKPGSSNVYFYLFNNLLVGALEVPSFCINTSQQTAVYLGQALGLSQARLKNYSLYYAYALFMLG